MGHFAGRGTSDSVTLAITFIVLKFHGADVHLMTWADWLPRWAWLSMTRSFVLETLCFTVTPAESL